MATLSETIQNGQQALSYGPNGELQYGQTTQPTLSQIAGQNGLGAAPITPGGAAALPGTTPDQQKMAGTPQQKAASLAASVGNTPQAAPATQPNTGTNLQQAVREQQASPTMSTQEQQGAQTATQLQGLGQVSSRVNDFINAQRQNLATAGTAPATLQAATSYNGIDLTQGTIPTDLAAAAANPNNMQAILQVNQDLGLTTQDTMLTPAQITDLYQSSASSTAAQGQAAVAPSLTVNQLVAQGNFGYTTDQLSQLLGVPSAQLGGMTVAQLGQQVNQLIANEYSQTQKTNQLAGSAEIGGAEQQLAQQAGQQLSASGTKEVEAGMTKLASSVAAGDTVQFNGQAYTVENLLQDGTISGIISNYLAAPAGSSVRTQLDTAEPQLSAFINQNQAALASASQQLQSGVTQFGNLQAANKAAGKVGTGYLSDQVAQALGIGSFDQLSASAINPASVPILAYAQSVPQGQQDNVRTNLEDLANMDPSLVQQLNTLTPTQLNNLGVNQTTSATGKPTPLQQFMQNQQGIQQLQATGNQDQFYSELGLTDKGTADTQLKQLALANALGGNLSSQQQALLQNISTTGPDGKLSLKNFQDVQSTVTGMMGGSLADYANGNTGTQLSDIQSELTNIPGSSTYNMVVGNIQANGLTNDGASQLGAALSYSDLKNVSSVLNNVGITNTSLAPVITQKAITTATSNLGLPQGVNPSNFATYYQQQWQGGTDISDSVLSSIKSQVSQYPEANNTLKTYVDAMAQQMYGAIKNNQAQGNFSSNEPVPSSAQALAQQMYSQAGLT